MGQVPTVKLNFKIFFLGFLVGDYEEAIEKLKNMEIEQESSASEAEAPKIKKRNNNNDYIYNLSDISDSEESPQVPKMTFQGKSDIQKISHISQ